MRCGMRPYSGTGPWTGGIAARHASISPLAVISDVNLIFSMPATHVDGLGLRIARGLGFGFARKPAAYPASYPASYACTTWEPGCASTASVSMVLMWFSFRCGVDWVLHGAAT